MINTFMGMKIISDSRLTVTGPAIYVKLTWRERWWRPWKRVKAVHPQIPDPNIYTMGGKCVMHPEILKELKKEMEKS